MADEVTEPLSDNQALNQMVDELEQINAFIAGRYDKVLGDANFITLNSGTPRIRGAVPLATKTIVTNKGPQPVEVRENGVAVLIVPANNTVEQGTLPLTGAGSLKFSVATGSANIAIATYQRTA